VRRSRHCILAAGVAVAVALSLSPSLAHAIRITSGSAALNNHAIQTTPRIKLAGTGNGDEGCTGGPPLSPRHLHGQDSFQRGLDGLRHQPVRALQAAYVRPQLKPATGSPEDEQLASGATGIRASGLRGTIAAPDISCPSARRWFRVRRSALSLWRPFGRARDDIHTLAFREWTAGRPARSKRGACMADVAAERMQTLDASFVDPEKDGTINIFHVQPGSRAGPPGDQLRQIFGGNPTLTCVMIRVHGQGLGPPGRPDLACAPTGGSGGQMGSGDRASLPGRSTRYRVIWLVCAHCGAKMAWLFYDERDIPLCANSPHGRMELQR
jgi:hypothetical protein